MLGLWILFASLFRLLRLTSAPPADSDPPARPSASDTAQRFNGDQIRMAEKINDLERDNYKDREKLRDRDARIKELEAKQVPDGALVLTGDDASRYQAFTALGKTPDEVTAALTQADAAITERDQLKRSMTIRQVAEASGYKPAVLERLGADLTYAVKDVTETVGGKQTTVKRAFVVTDGKETPLSDYAAAEWADFLPALGVTEPAPAPAYGTPPRTQQRGVPPPAESVPVPSIRL